MAVKLLIYNMQISTSKSTCYQQYTQNTVTYIKMYMMAWIICMYTARILILLMLNLPSEISTNTFLIPGPLQFFIWL